MARVSEGRFSAEEITEAYAAMHARVQGYAATGNWDGFADNFTEDAEYVEHAFGTFRGRDEIRAWSVRTMTTFPGGVMTGFPLAWQVVDAPSSRLICEVRNLMPDPGDGTHLEESNMTIMTYAGDGLFSPRGGRLQPAAVRADVGEVGADRRGARQPERRGPRVPRTVRG